MKFLIMFFWAYVLLFLSGYDLSYSATLRASPTNVQISPANTPPPIQSDAIPADAVWVSTIGNDTSGNGSANSPFKTIGKALSKVAAGGTVVVKSGTYFGKENFINSQINPFRAGTSTAFTKIRAENPYGVRIENSAALNYYDNLLGISQNYVQVDGFVFVQKDSTYPPYTGETSGDYVKITRSIFKRQGPCDAYGGFLYVGGSFNLVEDVAGVGHARYGINAGGPTATQSNTIFRRVVIRVDYVSSSQPKAAFSVYGNDASPTNVKNFLIQNMVILDGQGGTTSGEQIYGAIYQPKTTENIKFYGVVALNNQTYHGGVFMAEYPATKGNYLINSVVWGNGGAGIRANSGGGDTLWNQVTIGQHSAAVQTNPGDATNIISNALLFNTPTTGISSLTSTNIVTNGIPPLRYLVDRETNSAGAKILKRYGVSGTIWGQAGYDQETNENIWPWPYEDQIKAVFAESNPPPSGAIPSTNNTSRGFAALGNDPYGKPLTLTRYIWQYLGNQIPASIYGQ